MNTERSPVRAFTLVELLVVIGVIALLISILLPALNRARNAAKSAQCLSNLHQLATAAIMEATEHKGYLQTASDDAAAKRADPSRTKWMYVLRGGNVVVADWATAINPYVGKKSGEEASANPNVSNNMTKVFICPNDKWQVNNFPYGYWAGNNFPSYTGPEGFTDYTRISYGINVDIVSIKDPNQANRTTYNNNAWIGAVGGAHQELYTPGCGDALESKFDKVQKPSEVALFLDCGVRPTVSGTSTLDRRDSLYFTSNYNTKSIAATDLPVAGTLEGAMKKPSLGARFPLDRHDAKVTEDISRTDLFRFDPNSRYGRINVGFCDGHAASIARSDFASVRITPYKNR